MRTKLSLSIVLIFLFCFSCSKESNSLKPGEKNVLVDTIPNYITRDGEVFRAAFFDDQLRLKASKIYRGTSWFERDDPDSYVTIEYNQDGRIISGELEEGWKHLAKYHYSESKLDSIVVNSDLKRTKVVYKIQEVPSVPCKLLSYERVAYFHDTIVSNDSFIYEYLNSKCDHVVTSFQDGVYISKAQVVYSDKKHWNVSYPWTPFFLSHAYPELNKYFVQSTCELEENGTIVQCDTTDFSDFDFNDCDFVIRASNANYTYK